MVCSGERVSRALLSLRLLKRSSGVSNAGKSLKAFKRPLLRSSNQSIFSVDCYVNSVVAAPAPVLPGDGDARSDPAPLVKLCVTLIYVTNSSSFSIMKSMSNFPLPAPDFPSKYPGGPPPINAAFPSRLLLVDLKFIVDIGIDLLVLLFNVVVSSFI